MRFDGLQIYEYNSAHQMIPFRSNRRHARYVRRRTQEPDRHWVIKEAKAE